MAGHGYRALALCGPTAAGKSAAAVRLALQVGGEIINADSRQIYAGMPIGTGWPEAHLMAAAPHHLYGIVEPNERYGAGRFVGDAAAAIAGVVERGAVPILVGGTGLYIEALAGTMPLDRPVADDAIKARIRAEARVHPHDALLGWLRALAPTAAQRVPSGDAYRVLRALESELARRAGADAREPRASPVRVRLVVLDVQRDALRARIERRVRAMFDGGLVEEARGVHDRYGDAPALSGLAYAEALALAFGLATRDEAVRLAQLRSRRYAKRQQTWFRRFRDARIIDATNLDAGAIAALLHDEAREMTRVT